MNYIITINGRPTYRIKRKFLMEEVYRRLLKVAELTKDKITVYEEGNPQNRIY